MLYIEELTVNSIRNLKDFTLQTNPALNVFYGPNASGKTSILESIYLLSCLKSFRSKRISDVITKKHKRLRVFAKGMRENKSFSVGVEKGSGATQIKFNGEHVQTASQQAKNIPIYVLTPDYQLLFTGPPKVRRRWLDWSLFHVEQGYIEIWKKYHKALRQRNMLLKQRKSYNSVEIEGWERQIEQEANQIDHMRTKYIKEISNKFNDKHLPVVLLGDAEICYENSNYKEKGLLNVLKASRNEDAKKGFTTFGPHRTDISFDYQGLSVGKHLSRGQTKLFAAALVSTQLDKLKETGGSPIMLVDDLYAELDQESSEKTLNLLLANKTQTFVSSIAPPRWAEQDKNSIATFHVERGKIKKMVK
ncbi:MAG: hypothetical protein CMF40_06585 [Legionellales bacterium]|nr:hypothetical protein [Legionellales bacterium]|tara:strand:+ start:461 stop:1546 length:1086 start_codon:yes stop_codon:yes gene_type:complete